MKSTEFHEICQICKKMRFGAIAKYRSFVYNERPKNVCDVYNQRALERCTVDASWKSKHSLHEIK